MYNILDVTMLEPTPSHFRATCQNVNKGFVQMLN